MSEEESEHRIGARVFAERYRRRKLGDAQLVDVREPEEWEVYHLEGARLIPLQTLPRALDRLDPKRKIYVFCAHGVRSVHAVNVLYGLGFRNVVHVDGGLAEVMLHLEGK
ncbi:rhodanese-related sulfurtransferase [Melghirimyces profundicolus]|uniref:Rhodanese-related sulfurtransferase n=1 Tax=Melghirimyces profundicolus TaxID=1242148 RepID=A0A2T6BUW6_9BACL|nr:rhodanese-like domain-containing protein [Melghirimyces profundicolus]PTX59870.1 rhodanese-related sulfurtransferase [Melghirimyces profundicolus]